MAVQPETPLQQRIKKVVAKRGGYAVKQHGSMISEPGVPDILICYKGVFLAIEVKYANNFPTPQQGIHLRNIANAEGVTLVAWTTEEVEKVLDRLDYCYKQDYSLKYTLDEMRAFFLNRGLDDGSSY